VFPIVTRDLGTSPEELPASAVRVIRSNAARRQSNYSFEINSLSFTWMRTITGTVPATNQRSLLRNSMARFLDEGGADVFRDHYGEPAAHTTCSFPTSTLTATIELEKVTEGMEDIRSHTFSKVIDEAYAACEKALTNLYKHKARHGC
jgi:hypothetical protein